MHFFLTLSTENTVVHMIFDILKWKMMTILFENLADFGVDDNKIVIMNLLNNIQ